MKITFFILEQTEDATPFLALARGLKESGFGVSIAGPDYLRLEAEISGFEFRSIRYNYSDFISRSLEGKRGLFKLMRYMKSVRSVAGTMFRHTLEDCKDASSDARGIIYTDSVLAGVHLAERFGIPAIRVSADLTHEPTSQFPDPSIVHPDRDMGERLNLLTYKIARFRHHGFAETLNRWREDSLALPPVPRSFNPGMLRRRAIPRLIGISELFLPRPSDWGEHIYMTGFWNNWNSDLPENNVPSRELMQFIKDGDRPVCIDLSDMTGEMIGNLITDIKGMGSRVMVMMQEDQLDRWRPTTNIFPIMSSMRIWAYSRATAVVHDGIMKKTLASIITGRPTLVLAKTGESYFNGMLVKRAGAGDLLELSRSRAGKIREMTGYIMRDPDIRINAGTLRDRIREEDGVKKGSRIVGDIIQRHYGGSE